MGKTFFRFLFILVFLASCSDKIEIPGTASSSCFPGQEQACYSGRRDSRQKGECRAGKQICKADRSWGPCEGEVLPIPEICGDQKDNDCNGQIDEYCDSQWEFYEYFSVRDSYHVAFHPNGKLFATSSINEDQIDLWKITKSENDKYTFQIHQRLPKGLKPLDNMKFSPSGKYLPVLQSEQKSYHFFVGLWELDANQGQGAANILYDAYLLSGTNDTPKDAAFGLGESMLISAFRFHLYTHTLDNVVARKDSFPGHVVNIISTSPGGKFVAYPSENFVDQGDFPVSVRDLTTQQVRYVLPGSKAPVGSIQFRPNGTTLATSDNSTIFIWNLPPDEAPIVIQDHKEIDRIQWSPDGNLLASISATGTIKLWKATTGHLVQTIHIGQADGYTGGIIDISFHPDGKLFATVSHANRTGVAFDIKFWVLKKK